MVLFTQLTEEGFLVFHLVSELLGCTLAACPIFYLQLQELGIELRGGEMVFF